MLVHGLRLDETYDAVTFPRLLRFQAFPTLFRLLSLSISDTLPVIIVLLTEIMDETEHIVHMERGTSGDKHAYLVPEDIGVIWIFLIVLDFNGKAWFMRERT